ncbi:MAG TPA: hypothetical protein VFG07_01400 [Thermoplasmata archaeon]|nr:hypothetical protein [Thermoplasmata archaeon]
MPNHPPLPEAWLERPMNLFVSGGSRSVVNMLGLGIAQTLAERFIWLEIRDPLEPISPVDLRTLARIPKELRFIAQRPEDLRPDDADANLALWTVLPDEERHGPPPFADALRLPVFLRQILDRLIRSDRPVLLVVANTDRVAEFYPARRHSSEEWLRLLREQNLSLIATWTGAARPDWTVFETAFRVEPPTENVGGEGTVVVEQFSPPTAGWELGSRRPLRAMPGAASLLDLSR